MDDRPDQAVSDLTVPAGEAPVNRLKGRELALLALIALVLRLIHLDYAPHFDELYHVLAARSWAADGTLALADGIYQRTALFTKLIGLLYRVFDNTLLVARIPSLVAGTAWVVLIASWTSTRAGRVAGWIAGLLFAVDPGAISLSQFARFYALQGLFFLVGATGTFNLVEQWPDRSASWRWKVAVVTAAALLAALYLQVTTIIGLIALAAWAVCALFVRWRASRSGGRATTWGPVALSVVVLALALVLWTGGAGVQLWQMYRGAPLWASGDLNRIRFYEEWFAGRYQVLWALFPIAVLVAATHVRRVTLFATGTFGVAFLLFSFAGSKSERYLYIAMPFFFIIWSIAVAAAIPAFRRVLDEALGSVLRLSGRLRTSFGWAGVVAAVLFIAYYNDASWITRHLLYPGDMPRPYSGPEWGKAAPLLRRLADSADVVVSSALPKSIYFVGRGDITLSLTELSELERRNGTPVEFSIDPRTGRPAMSSPESLERVVNCFARGLAIIEDYSFRTSAYVPDSTAAHLTRNTSEVPLDPAWGLRAFRWQRDSAAARPDCPKAHPPAPYAEH